MGNWFTYFRQGLGRNRPEDPIGGRREGLGTKERLACLLPYLRRHRRKAWGVVGVIGLSALLALPQPLVIRYIIDNVILSRRVDLLLGALCVLVGFLLAERLAKAAESFSTARLEQYVNLDIQRDLIERVLGLPKAFFDDQQTGYLMSRLTADARGLRWFFSGTVVFILTNALRFLGGVGLLFYLEWKLALVVVLVLPVAMVCMGYFSSKVHTLSHQSLEKDAGVSSRMQDTLSSASLVKAFAAEGREMRRLLSELRAVFRISLEWTAVHSAAELAVSMATGVAHIAALGLGAYWVIEGRWSLGSLMAFVAYLGFVFGPARYLAAANLQMQEALASLDRVSAVFAMVPEQNLAEGRRADRLRGEIEFKDVSFSYGKGAEVLQGVSFRIEPGQHVAVVGPSGVGKTTLVSLVLAFYRPQAGEICFDGVPVLEYALGSLRERIGYVAQKTRLVSGTVMENLRFGNPDADQDQVVRAATKAGIHEFIMSLPQGYDTATGEDGVNLSEGQRQRVSIARALLKDPDILVFDEPTSALDLCTERPILDSVWSFAKGRTVFLVTNRVEALEKSDQVFLFNERRLVAVGTHASLLEDNAYYRELIACGQA